MTIKGLLLGSVATIAVGTAAANAADAVVAPEPEHVEYVRVCDAYGAGYFYIRELRLACAYLVMSAMI